MSDGATISWWNIATTVATFAAVAVAIYAVRIEHRRENKFSRAELLNTLRSEYISDAMKHKRRKAAKNLLSDLKNPNTPRDGSWLQGGQALCEVLDFWEMVGICLRRGALDRDMVWHIFSIPAWWYWHSAREYLDSLRQDKTVYENFLFLINTGLEIERERKVKPSPVPSTAQLKEFLEGESALTLDSHPESARSVDGLLADEPSNEIEVPQQ